MQGKAAMNRDQKAVAVGAVSGLRAIALAIGCSQTPLRVLAGREEASGSPMP